MQNLTPQAFVAKWRGDIRKERSVSQEHFIDLCRMLGHETPGENRDGSLAFEAGVSKGTGKQGWADVWKKGYFAWEYKGPHADLNKAYQQIQQYRESLQNPPLLIVSDIQSIVIHTNFTNTVKKVTTITLEDLLTPQGFAQLRAAFYDPDSFRVAQTTEEVTQEAAAEFSKLATILRKYGEDPQKIAHFLIRLLFCLFAEDIGLLPPNLFSRLVSQTRGKSSAFAGQLRQLFDAMATGGWFGADEILHFNGKLFDNAEVLELDSDGLTILAKVSQLDWSSIEPSILGTLFERSLDPAKRSQLGAHYTSREDILLIVEPVLMAPLRRQWDEVKQQAEVLATHRDSLEGAKATRARNELQRLLRDFAQAIANTRVLDPACGSGNFLYVALKQLLDLEKEVIAFAGQIGAGTFFPQVGPEQMRGIELNEYAHELAQVTVWIGYIQWLRDNGFGQPSVPILKSLDTITKMDAILAFDEYGRPIEPVWPDADVIIGNPPFLGDKKMRSELGDKYVETLRKFYEGRVPGGADFVIYWFERSYNLIEIGKIQRVGLISTNSIRMGVSRQVLARIKQTGDIFMAWSDRPWIVEGAAVRVSMIGFDNGNETEKYLNGEPVREIFADLSASVNITQAKNLSQNEGLCFLGMMKGGPFDIDEQIATRLLTAPLNPNGRPNSDVIRPRLGGQDITGHPRKGWVIDFNELSLEEASLYEQPFEYVTKVVKPIRDLVRDTRMRTRWWLHGRSRPALRSAINAMSRCIITPEVAKYRLFVWMPTDTVPDHTCHVIARDDDYFFGVLHSRLHEKWSLAMGNYMGVGNDPRYNSTKTFETFPFPWAPGQEPTDDPRVIAISEAAKRLVELRDNWLNPEGASEAELKKRTLTNLYNQRPTWLDLAHKKLDAAVFDAYAWPHDLSDDEILERLLALNLERATK